MLARVQSLVDSTVQLVTDEPILVLTFLAVVFAYIEVRNTLFAAAYNVYDSVASATGLFGPRIASYAIERPSEDDGRQVTDITLSEDIELVYFRIVFRAAPLVGVRFELFRWWIGLPDGVRALRRTDVEQLADENELPTPGETSLNTDDVRINPEEEPTYDNIDFGYLETKHFVLKRHLVRGEVPYFGTKENRRVHVPLWIDLSEYDGTEDAPSIEVTVDPPHLPYLNTTEIDVEIPDTGD
ncbi:hypothetical protein Huta_1791 [Halorhabdus utahensis DSM 12940]|uniref:Uncharacterized protein n=2 Tax=Halorhabdus utahensis TaxID=146826 RepID=C7NRM7_HALUD|nr:hypothetical protein Huta_1791 [Halorhabdus utahensis DSM 12940]